MIAGVVVGAAVCRKEVEMGSIGQGVGGLSVESLDTLFSVSRQILLMFLEGGVLSRAIIYRYLSEISK